jgi:DNA-binding transcriptional MocR family regulator
LTDALADAIAQGHFGLGSRLPSERMLAHHLLVARGTVVAAYDALRARGIVETRRGSGTVVQGRAVQARAHRAPLLSRLIDDHQTPIDLALSAVSLHESEIADITVSMRRASRLVPAHGYAPLGLSALRSVIAERFSANGVPTGPDQILITTGGQSALSLIATTLVRANDRVITEAPTYPGAIEVFVRSGARVDGVERDHAGPIISRLEQVLARGAVRLVYVIPTSHNPTGAIMSESRRLALLRLALAARATIVEDAIMEDLALERRPPPSLAALAPERVITIGSLSKTVWGGLRVGWIRAPGETILRLGRVRASLDLGSPVLEQAAALEIFEHYDDLVARRRALIRTRLGILCAELRARLPDWSFTAPGGGLSVWVKLPRGSADDLVQLALRRGVAIASGRTAAPGEEFLSHVRLSAGPEPRLLREGVARLAWAWEEMNTRTEGHEEHVLA